MSEGEPDFFFSISIALSNFSTASWNLCWSRRSSPLRAYPPVSTFPTKLIECELTSSCTALLGQGNLGVFP